jgi:uncharacterized protein YpmB
MNRNLKWAIIILVILVVIFLIYKFAFKKSKFKKGYAKNSGDWVAFDATEYDKDYYTGQNSSGAIIFFKKGDVKLQDDAKKTGVKSAIALKPMNIYYLK